MSTPRRSTRTSTPPRWTLPNRGPISAGSVERDKARTSGYRDDPILTITVWVTAIATGLLLAVLEIAPRLGPPTTSGHVGRSPDAAAHTQRGSVERGPATRHDQPIDRRARP